MKRTFEIALSVLGMIASLVMVGTGIVFLLYLLFSTICISDRIGIYLVFFFTLSPAMR